VSGRVLIPGQEALYLVGLEDLLAWTSLISSIMMAWSAYHVFSNVHENRMNIGDFYDLACFS
jgi:hypothetical protein